MKNYTTGEDTNYTPHGVGARDGQRKAAKRRKDTRAVRRFSRVPRAPRRRRRISERPEFSRRVALVNDPDLIRAGQLLDPDLEILLEPADLDLIIASLELPPPSRLAELAHNALAGFRDDRGPSATGFALRLARSRWRFLIDRLERALDTSLEGPELPAVSNAAELVARIEGAIE